MFKGNKLKSRVLAQNIFPFLKAIGKPSGSRLRVSEIRESEMEGSLLVLISGSTVELFLDQVVFSSSFDKSM